jgi:hypothetical protein
MWLDARSCMRGRARAERALKNIFPVARQRNVKFVIGTALNVGFISGSPRYNYGKTSWNIPHQYIEKRERLRAVAAQFGADLRTAALQFSAAPARMRTQPRAVGVFRVDRSLTDLTGAPAKDAGHGVAAEVPLRPRATRPEPPARPQAAVRWCRRGAPTLAVAKCRSRPQARRWLTLPHMLRRTDH